MNYRFASVGLFLILFWLEVSTLGLTAPTADEPMYITRGFAVVQRGRDRLPGCHPCSPVLPFTLSGLALSLEPDLQLAPDDNPIWADNGGTGVFEQFLWSNTAPPQRMVFLSRLPIIFVSLLLGALIFRWASERSGLLPALGALTLYVFCPNMLAHGRLVTADVTSAATFALSAYVFNRALSAPARSNRLWSGVALGLALASKVSAVVLPVAFAIQAAAQAWWHRHDRRAAIPPLITALVTLGVGGLTLWAIYRFSVGPVEPGRPAVPAPAYWGEWEAVNTNMEAPLPAYLFGEVTTHGWWHYYLVAFLVKTPVPVLLLMLLAAIRALRRGTWRRDLLLFLVPGLVFGGLLFSAHDLGYRYVLPVLPFVFVLSADVFAAARRARWSRISVGLLVAWQVAGVLSIYPYYLAYFNELAGGIDNGRFILADSNIDWGQDLIGLKDYVDRHQITDLYFSYFGAADPAAYGLHTYALPPVRSAMHNQGVWWLHRYYPHDPPPGVYAISVSNLVGSTWIDQDAYAFFRDQKPDATIGHSIDVYTIPPRGTAVDLSLSGLQIDQIDPATYARFGTNDVRPRWFDATTSLIAAPGPSWVAIADAQTIAPELASLFAGVEPVVRAQTIEERQLYRLYFFDLDERLARAARQSEQEAGWSADMYPAAGVNPVALPVWFGDTAALLGYRVVPGSAPNAVTVITYWRAGKQAVTPLQLFVHAIGSEGQIVAQEDRLDVPAFGWQEGDLIAQVNRLTIPIESDPPWIQVGLYHAETGQRLPVMSHGVEVDQRLLLKPTGPP